MIAGVSTSRFRIGALLPIGPEYSGRLLEGALAYALECADVEVLDLGYLRDGPAGAPPAVQEVHGLLVWLRQNDEWAGELIRRGIVVVNASADRPAVEVPRVVFDRASVVRQAIDHLDRLDRRQYLFVGCAISPVEALGDRVRMFVDGFLERGRRVDVLELGVAGGIENRTVVLSFAQQRTLIRKLRQLKGPAAIWCEDDFVARIVCDTAAEIGLAVPGDVAVLGLGDYRVSRAGRPLLSTIPAPGQLIGRRAVERVVAILRGQAAPAESLLVPFPAVVIRDSTEHFALEETAYHRVLTMIHQHACEGLRVQDLLPSVPHSQRTFTRRFRELHGRTPGEMIREVRVGRAKQYLRDSALSVGRIAELCGFEESGKFSYFFKRETGMTPGGFRRSGGNGTAGE